MELSNDELLTIVKRVTDWRQQFVDDIIGKLTFDANASKFEEGILV
jgi:hypothetical protein